MIAGLPKVGVTTPLGGAAQRRCHFGGGQREMEILKHLTKKIGMVIIVLLCITVAAPSHAMDVTLAWDANSESDLAGYKIYYGTHSGPPYSNTMNVPLTLQSFNPDSPQYTVQGLTNGVTYYFVATAYNTQDVESDYSNEVYNDISASNPAPSISLLEVNGSSGSTTVYTNDPNRHVDIRIVASDNAAVNQYLILDGKNDPTGGVFTAIPGGARQSADFTIYGFTLNNSDGNHTISAWVKDDQGVLSTVVSKTNVVLDRTGPTAAISYSKAGPYKPGDTVVVTAIFTDANSISGTPKINIDFAGTGNDISGANMTQVTNNRWTYTMTVPSGNNGTATVTVTATDVAGNAAGAYSGNTFVVDNAAPSVSGFPTINYADYSITVTYNETNMKNAAVRSNYSFDNGLLLSGNGVDVTGVGQTFKLPLNPVTLQPYIIYSMQISSSVTDSAGNAVSPNKARVNDDDNDGMADDWEKKWFGSISAKNGSADSDGDGLADANEYSYSRQNPAWIWALSPLNPDSDGDGMPDGYEVLHKLNPTNAADKNLDSDGDGWSNWEEYLNGTDPSDPNSSPSATAPTVKTVDNKKQVLPKQNEPAVASDSGFAVLLESASGIDVTDPSAVTLNVNDGVSTYTRNLNDKNANGYPMVQAVPLDGSATASKELWVIYYRTAETAMTNFWPYSSSVQVSVTAKDVSGNAMAAPETFTFNTETWADHDKRMASKPQLNRKVDGTGLVTISDPNTGLIVEFRDNLPVEPYIDGSVPLGNLSPVAVSIPVNLVPHCVFSEGADVFIPTPDNDTVSNSGLSVYGYDGEEWVPIIDASGTDLTEGTWVVPGWNNGLSWQVVDHGNPSGIWIKVYHFSSFVAGYSAPTGTSAAPAAEGEPAGGGCFISTISGE
jgi:chitinase